MSLPVEDRIMAAVGFRNSIMWNEGSDSGTRMAAAVKLPDALRSHGFTPDARLMNLYARVAQYGTERSPYPRRSELAEAWRCAADVIRAHIDRDHNPDASFEERVEELVDRYPPPATRVDAYGGVYSPADDMKDARPCR